MKNRLPSSAFVLLLLATPAAGQTASDIEQKYGKPVKAYAVTERVWMTPEYAGDGRVCRMRLYPRRISGDAGVLAKELPFEDFNRAVEELVPPGSRGAKARPFVGGWTFGGGIMFADFEYENVTITFWAGFRFDPEAFIKSEPFDLSEMGVDFPVDKSEAPARPPDKPEDEFLSYHKSRVELVTIRWNGRRCAGR